MSMDFTYTPEELAYMEHKLEIERQKCAKAIERQKQVIEELQPKGFSGMFSKNKEKIKKEEEALTQLEDQYIELTNKTGMDLLIEEKSGINKKDKKNNFSIGSDTLNAVGSAIESASGFIPIPGAKTAGKLIGDLLKKNK